MNALQKETCRAIVNVFESGKVRGDYGAIAVMKGDAGHLSYGRSQVSLGSRNLFKLLDQYCSQTGAIFADSLRPLLPRFHAIDVSLDQDTTVKQLLVRAAREDPVMRATQDQYFNQNFLAPALVHAEAFGIATALGQTIVYDSHVQGGWAVLSLRIGKVGMRREQDWIGNYIQARRTWLLSLKAPLPTTVYRMDSFQALFGDGNFELRLPLRAHGVMITEEALAGGETAPQGVEPRTLRLTSPYLRGDDVEAVQRALAAQGLPIPADGVYGPFTDALVQKWQKSKNVAEKGVGAKTRVSLGVGKASAGARAAG